MVIKIFHILSTERVYSFPCVVTGGTSPIGNSPATSSKRKPTSSPKKWPGVRLLRSLLITEAKDNASKLKVGKT